MQGDKIYRYEKLIYKNPDLNKSYKDVEEFFAFYFKERFFREG